MILNVHEQKLNSPDKFQCGYQYEISSKPTDSFQRWNIRTGRHDCHNSHRYVLATTVTYMCLYVWVEHRRLPFPGVFVFSCCLAIAQSSAAAASGLHQTLQFISPMITCSGHLPEFQTSRSVLFPLWVTFAESWSRVSVLPKHPIASRLMSNHLLYFTLHQ